MRRTVRRKQTSARSLGRDHRSQSIRPTAGQRLPGGPRLQVRQTGAENDKSGTPTARDRILGRPRAARPRAEAAVSKSRPRWPARPRKLDSNTNSCTRVCESCGSFYKLWTSVATDQLGKQVPPAPAARASHCP